MANSNTQKQKNFKKYIKLLQQQILIINQIQTQLKNKIENGTNNII